jgi:hypothetical protein
MQGTKESQAGNKLRIGREQYCSKISSELKHDRWGIIVG